MCLMNLTKQTILPMVSMRVREEDFACLYFASLIAVQDLEILSNQKVVVCNTEM